MFTHVAARTVRWPPTGPFLEVLQIIRRLLTRPDCFRLEREFAGPDFHRGERCALPRHTDRAEKSRQPTRQRERKMQRFKSACAAQKLLSAHTAVHNNLQMPSHLSSTTSRAPRRGD